MRPWEYFNEMAGGAENGYKYFNDEGVDLSQRVGEMAAYYHAYLEPNGQVPAVFYFSKSRDVRSRGMDYVGRIPDRDDPVFDQETFTGTVMVGANELGEAIWWDVAKPFRGVEPVARLGNVFVFQGTFPMPRAAAARRLFYRTIYNKLYVEAPDLAAVADDLQRSLSLDDSCYFVGLELGNVYLRLNDGDKAIEAYRRSLSKAPREDAIYNVIAQQIERLQTEPLNTISALRDPGLE
jgi:tetratricopeptide (TPR) repeat protein